MDWLVPTADFHARAGASTAVGAGLMVLAGFRAALKSRRIDDGSIAGFQTAAIALPVSFAGVATLLVAFHDSRTQLAMGASGGLQEVFILPVAMLVVGLVLGTAGGLVGVAAARSRPEGPGIAE